MAPLNWLWCRLRCKRFASDPSAAGIGPLSRFPCSQRNSMLGSDPSSDGIAPLSWLSLRER